MAELPKWVTVASSSVRDGELKLRLKVDVPEQVHRQVIKTRREVDQLERVLNDWLTVRPPVLQEDEEQSNA